MKLERVAVESGLGFKLIFIFTKQNEIKAGTCFSFVLPTEAPVRTIASALRDAAKQMEKFADVNELS